MTVEVIVMEAHEKEYKRIIDSPKRCERQEPMADNGSAVSREKMVHGLRRLGASRLVDECEIRMGSSYADVADDLDGKTATAIAEFMIDQLETGFLSALAAEGDATARTPPVGGPSWSHVGRRTLDQELVFSSLEQFKGALPPEWRDAVVELNDPQQLFDGIIYIHYTSIFHEPQIGGGFSENYRRNTALILLDYSDQIVTVSANAGRDALAIGAAWAGVTGCDAAPVVLDFLPSLKQGKFSTSALQLLEAVYGRATAVGDVVNVHRIATLGLDKQNPLGRTAKRDDDDILLNPDIRNELRRGDQLTSIAFQFNYPYTSAGHTKYFVTNVTIASDAGALIIRVTRGAHSLERASALYVQLRRAIAAPTSAAGVKALRQRLAEIAAT
jgi:hypothetical protein